MMIITSVGFLSRGYQGRGGEQWGAGTCRIVLSSLLLRMRKHSKWTLRSEPEILGKAINLIRVWSGNVNYDWAHLKYPIIKRERQRKLKFSFLKRI